MGYITEQTYSSEAWEDAQNNYPSLPLKAQMSDFLVRKFPRRFFSWLSPRQQEKIISHAIFLSKSLDAAESGPLPANMEFGLAGDNVVKEMAAHPEALPAEVYSKRVANGDICYYLKVDDTLVCYNWINIDCFSIYGGFDEEIRFEKPANGKSVYTYDFYTYNDERGKGYGALLKSCLLRQLARDGYARIFSCVHHDTRASLKVHKDLGYEVFGVAYMYRLMQFSFVLWANRALAENVKLWFEKYV
jgi:GNAT superfamily N-acetyltransferase